MDKLSDIDASTKIAGLVPSIWAGVADPHEVGFALQEAAAAHDYPEAEDDFMKGPRRGRREA